MGERLLSDQLYADLKDVTTKIGRRAFDVLDRQEIASIITNGYVYWFEDDKQVHRCSAEVYRYLQRFIEKNYKLRYIYDV